MVNKEWAQLDQLILDETNIKQLTRHICMTEKGSLALIFKDGRHYITLNTEEINAPKTLEAILGKVFSAERL